MRYLAIVSGVVAAVTTGCQPPPPALPPQKPPQVIVSKAVVQQVTDFEDFTGRTEATGTVAMQARVGGYLVNAPFKEGDEVQKGDLLFEIDPRPLRAELERTEALVAQAEARLKRLESDHARARSLVSRGGVSQEEFEKIAGDFAEARSAVRSAGAAREIAKLDLEYSKITSPLHGKIGRRMIDPGNMVKANDTTLAYIAAYDPMYIYFDVDERTYLRLVRFLERQGKANLADVQKIPVFVGLADEEGFPHQGKISFVDNRVDQTTGSVWVRGVLANPRNLMAPGLFVRVRIPVGDPHNATLIPEQAVGTDQAQKFVYVVDGENKPVYRPVKVGAQHGQLRVIEQGIEPGEPVIVSGLQRVRPNVPVEPKEEGASSADARGR